MAESSLGQVEADALMAMAKRRRDTREWDYPDLGGTVTIPLISTCKREPFLLDLQRSRLDFVRGTYQNRARRVVVLARLDFGGRPHRNPDDELIGSPHLHLYREGYDDKWAFPVPSDSFADPTDAWRTLQDFLRFCNVVEPPFIRKGLFT